MFQGLSTDQAPPIQAPLRFFLTAPLFGIAAAVLILFGNPEELLSRYSLSSIAVVHTITIGFFAFVMLGALTQMLPVLAGVKIEAVEHVTKYTHLSLILGLLSMVGALYTSWHLLYLFAMIELGVGFLTLVVLIAHSIKGVQNFTPTVKNMAIALFFAFFTGLMGVMLLGEYASMPSAWHLVLANIHSVWGIFGFGGILIVGVSFQVLPMFYVAPQFKPFCLQKVAKILSFGLILWMALQFFVPEYGVVAKIIVALFLWAFATTLWLKLNGRKRKISDITIWYWRMGALFLTLGLFLWVADEFLSHAYSVEVALLIGIGFLMSIMVGMLYKIIPFLVWFHLNASGYMSIPTMNEMISKRLTYMQFFLFYFSLVGLLISCFYPQFVSVFASAFILSMAILEYNVVSCALLYAKIKKTKPDFDMSAFG